MGQYDNWKTGKAFRYGPGLGNVGSYQASGIPWITGSGANGIASGAQHRIKFPMVTRAFTVINMDAATAAEIRVHFHDRHSPQSPTVIAGQHYMALSGTNDSMTFNVRCKEIYISNASTSAGTFRIVAELTNISTNEMVILTGSGLTDGPNEGGAG